MEINSDQLVVMRDVYSNEYYKSAKNHPVQVLKNISFETKRAKVWSILGNSVFEIMLLTEIMAGARTYQKGQCSLSGLGMMRRKRTVLPHTFYIGSTNMLFNNMKVLEYLMFATSKNKIDPLIRQKQILEKLIAVGLDFVALTPIEILTPEEKAVVTLFCATYSQSSLLIMNLPRLIYDLQLVKVMANISELIISENKTLIITTQCFELAQAISTDVMLIHEGCILHKGNKQSFLEKYDKVIYLVQVEDTQNVLSLLSIALPQYTYSINDTDSNIIQVFDYNKCTTNENFYNVFCKIGITPQAIIRNELSLKNAYIEILREKIVQKENMTGADLR